MSHTWSDVRDNHLVFWTGWNWITNPSSPASSFTLQQVSEIKTALEVLYTRSPTFKAMIDEWIDAGGKLQIGSTAGDMIATQGGSDPLNRYILINFDRIESQNWVNDLGELVSDRLEVTLAHELAMSADSSTVTCLTTPATPTRTAPAMTMRAIRSAIRTRSSQSWVPTSRTTSRFPTVRSLTRLPPTWASSRIKTTRAGRQSTYGDAAPTGTTR